MRAETKPTHPPTKPKFQPNRCRGVSHTPSRERKRNQPIPQSSPNFNRTSVGAYRIRPHVSGNETMAANTAPSSAVHFRPCGGRMRYAPTVLRYREMMQKRLEVTSCPNCSLYKTIFTLFNALLYTTQSPLNSLQGLFVHVQTPLNQLQDLFVHMQTPLN